MAIAAGLCVHLDAQRGFDDDVESTHVCEVACVFGDLSRARFQSLIEIDWLWYLPGGRLEEALDHDVTLLVHDLGIVTKGVKVERWSDGLSVKLPLVAPGRDEAVTKGASKDETCILGNR